MKVIRSLVCEELPFSLGFRYRTSLEAAFVAASTDIDAINGQDDVYLEFVPIPARYSTHRTHTLMQGYQLYILRPITTHNPLSKEMFDHHFPNWLPFFIE